MFNYRTPITVTALLLIFLLAAPGAECLVQGWVLLAPAGEGFSVRLPVKPEEETDRVPVMGNTYQMRLYTSIDEASGIMYMVAMQEFPTVTAALEPSKRIDQFMKGFKEGLAKQMAASGLKPELVADRDLDLKGHLGRQYKLTVAESRGLVRAFDGTARAYVLMVMGGDEQNPNVARFFDSFEITPAPPPVPKPITPD